MGEDELGSDVEIDMEVGQERSKRFLSVLVDLAPAPFLLIPAAVMVGIGYNYQNTCPIGVSSYLYYAGIILLTLHVVRILVLSIIHGINALTDGDWKKQLKWARIVAIIVHLLADLIVVIWGSFLVFGAFYTWSYNEDDIGKTNYCSYTPFMTAYVTLIIIWIFLPCPLITLCFALLDKISYQGVK